MNDSTALPIRLIAFYLPQFHPIPENDAWWGKGFTEWTNVAKAVPYFPGHHQPQLPADLGFYDLRLPETREAQARLASEYGIHGFCYYYYWFAGRRILERPLQEVFESGKPDFPFCICWANENWSRRWDGSENEILLQQEHNLENDVAFIHDVIPLLKDPRYIRVNGAPIVLIYRLTLMDDPARTIRRWREICAEQGLERIHVCGVESFDIVDAPRYGCDASAAFPPHRIGVDAINDKIPGLAAEFTGQIMDYRDVVRQELSRSPPSHRLYPGVMVAWDNTARRGKAGKVFAHSTPDEYEHWLSAAIVQASDTLPEGERLVFINAWNEWAEGAHLEPDSRQGHQYLEATRRALENCLDAANGLRRARVARRAYLDALSYRAWLQGHALGKRELRAIAERLATRSPAGGRFHLAIIVPLAKIEYLLGTLESLENQLYVDGWRVTLVADIPEPPGLSGLPMLRWLARGDREALAVVNDSLATVEAEWVGMIEAGDRLSSHAMFAISEAVQRHPEWVMAYTDEDAVDADGERANGYFKPDFGIDLVRGAPFSVGGLAVYQRAFFRDIAGFDPDMAGIEYWDFALRAHERVGDRGIGHIADVLYHRFVEGGHCERTGDELAMAGKRALENHLARVGLTADIREGLLPGTYHIRYQHPGKPLVSVIIPTKDQPEMIRRCVESLLAKTRYPKYEILIVDNDTRDPEAKAYLAGLQAHPNIRVLPYPRAYNFSAMNNLAAHEAKGDFLLLLNNDTAVLQDDWLDEMLALGQRSDVGVVGARLRYPDGRLQHAGIILGMRGFPAEHAYIGMHPDEPGYFGRGLLTQNLSAVTGACLLIRASLYRDVGGLDEESFGVSYNDVDLCLKVREQGQLVVWTPHADLLHEGSKSQQAGTEGTDEGVRERRFTREARAAYAKWGIRLGFDPYYNRNLRLADRNVRIETRPALTWDPDWRPSPRILAHPADFLGCGEYRILAPARALDKSGMAWLWATPTYLSVPELFRMQPDTVIFQRQKYGYQVKAMENVYSRYGKAFRIYELDDLITNVPVKSRMRDDTLSHKELQRYFREAVGLCHRLVVSTEYLAEQYKGYTDEVVVMPNYLPDAAWGAQQPSRRQGRKARVGWAGGGGHDGDLALIADVVKATADEVDWIFFGMCPAAIRERVREYHPGVPLREYPAMLASLDLDLAVAPLEDVPFNHAKSHLRILEYGILGYPVIATDITPYRGAFPIIRVANRFKDWVDAIREHVSDRDQLARRGDALREHIVANWMLEDHLDQWLKAWQQ